jgi:hypothetical protein
MKLCASILGAVLCKLNEAFDLIEKQSLLLKGGSNEEWLPGLRFGDGM